MSTVEIFEKDGFTYKKVQSKEGQEPRSIVLLTCSIVLFAITANKELVLMSVNGEMKVVKMKSLATKPDFTKTIRPESFHGTQTDLEILMQYWYNSYRSRDNVELVYLENFQGRYHGGGENFWVLKNHIYFAKTKKIMEYNNTIWWYGEGEKKIFFINNLQLPSDFAVQILDEPKLQELNHAFQGRSVLTEKQMLSAWFTQYGDKELLSAMLGWFVGLMYLPEIQAETGRSSFPLFAVSGITQTGKTALLTNLMRFWGGWGNCADYSQVSLFVELKTISMMHNIPVWRDEFRDSTGKGQNKDSLLRSIYDRKSLSKGTATQEFISYEVNGGYLLSGEDVTIDPAVRRRFLYYQLYKKDKLHGEQWEEACMKSDLYLWRVFWLALEKGFNAAEFNKCLVEAKENLKTENDKNEEAIVYAVLGAVFGRETFEFALGWNAKKAMEREEDGDYERQRVNIVDQFFNATLSYFHRMEWWKGNKNYGNYIMGKCLNYFEVSRDGTKLLINIVSLADQIFGYGGFQSETKLSKRAIANATLTELNGKRTTGTIAGQTLNVIAIATQSIAKDSPLHLILLNVLKEKERWEDSQTPFQVSQNEPKFLE